MDDYFFGIRLVFEWIVMLNFFGVVNVCVEVLGW